MLANSSRAVKIFFSYAREDEPLRDELAKRLSPLMRAGQIEEWYDRRIEAGEDKALIIDKRLDAADLILLLVSPDFFASDHCYNVELRRALERCEAGAARVIPILLRAVNWRDAPFGGLQPLPANARPLTSWSNQDEAFAEIAQGIGAVVKDLLRGTAGRHAPGRLSQKSFQVPRLLPYLCDRSDQEMELGPALRSHQKKTPRRAFFCVIHGDQDECHSEFLERLKCDTLPRLLSLEARGLSVEHYTLSWPSRIRAGGMAVPSAFPGLLGHSVLGDGAASTEEVFDAIPPERPVMIALRLKTEDLADGGLAALAAFFDYWNAGPELPMGRALICVVSVRHQRLDKFDFFLRRKLKKTHEEVGRFLNGLDFDRYPGLGGVVLPELKAITHHDVMVWSESKPVRAVCYISEKEIDSLFARRDLCTRPGHISMQALADELETLVMKYRH